MSRSPPSDAQSRRRAKGARSANHIRRVAGRAHSRSVMHTGRHTMDLQCNIAPAAGSPASSLWPIKPSGLAPAGGYAKKCPKRRGRESARGRTRTAVLNQSDAVANIQVDFHSDPPAAEATTCPHICKARGTAGQEGDASSPAASGRVGQGSPSRPIIVGQRAPDWQVPHELSAKTSRVFQCHPR